MTTQEKIALEYIRMKFNQLYEILLSLEILTHTEQEKLEKPIIKSQGN